MKNSEELKEVIEKFDKLQVTERRFILNYIRAAEQQKEKKTSIREKGTKAESTDYKKQKISDRYGTTLNKEDRVVILTKGKYGVRKGDLATIIEIVSESRVDIYLDRANEIGKTCTYRQASNLVKIDRDE